MTSYEHKVKNIYLGSPGWSPGENTYAYYPLTENANDTSGNNRNLTADSSITYSTQNGAFLPNSRHTGMLEQFNINTNNTWTFSWWQNTMGLAGQTDARGIDIYQSTTNRILTSYDTQQKYNFGIDNSVTTTYSTPGQTNTWYHFVITIGANRQIKFYMNGELKYTGTVNSFTSSYFRWGQEYNNGIQRQLYGYLKDIIIESKARTTQEISDYYNQTKSNYGL